MTAPTIDVRHDPPLDAHPIGHLKVRAADELDRVEVRIRYDGRRGTRRALALLARASIELLVAARDITPVLPPEHEAPASREMEGARWHG